MEGEIHVARGGMVNNNIYSVILNTLANIFVLTEKRARLCTHFARISTRKAEAEVNKRYPCHKVGNESIGAVAQR